MIILIAVILYASYSTFWVFIAGECGIPETYSGWVLKYPSWKKRLLLFIVSGFIVQFVIMLTFIWYIFLLFADNTIVKINHYAKRIGFFEWMKK